MPPADNDRGEPAVFFPDSGEMSTLIRGKDWSQTPIGSADYWSPTLRTLVSFLLANRFPMLLWWGPEYISIYNDAYRPILGVKHPWALGQPVATCWSEIWHILKPLIDTPYHGGPATWSEDIELEINRHGFIEETHFTVAYSPVPDETAPHGIGGVLATVHEITEKVVAERRTTILRDLGIRAVEARSAEEACAAAAAVLANHTKDLPFALLYLIEAEGREARLAGAVGVTLGEAIGPHVIPLDPASADSPWPLGEAAARETIVTIENLANRFAQVPAGPWSDPPRTAVVVPVFSNKAHELAGLLVAGISPRLNFDEQHQSFVELVGARIATNVANARAYEEEHRRAEALAEIDRAKTTFFSNVSHEFRTPLTLMLGPLEEALAKAPEGGASDLFPLIDTAHRNGLRLLKLVNTLLDFSRIEAGRVQANYRPTDLAALTAELVSNFRAACERAGLRLDLECRPLARPVYVDGDMWEKIVLNLLSNAFKFTFEGGITVAVRPSADGGAAELVVRDTGTGIPERELPQLFERFHRVEGARGRSFEGSGIGLALVQELVRLHGGTISVESEVGRGTAFTVALPFGADHLARGHVRAEEGTGSTGIRAQAYVDEALTWLPQADGDGEIAEFLPSRSALDDLIGHDGIPAGSGRVLLADDNADMREYTRRLLAEQGYTVEAVGDGAAALDAARQRLPDVLVSDIMMPKLDGFELLRELRADPSTSNIPTILLSARAGEEASIEGLQAGADDYLTKPFSARELIARVAANLKMSRLRQETAQRMAEELATMTLLHEVGQACARAENEFGACLDRILDAAIGIAGAAKGNIQLLDAADGVLRIARHRNFDEPFLRFFAEVAEGEAAACGAAMRAGERVVIEDVAQSPIFDGQPSLNVLLGAGIRAVHSMPLIGSSGGVLGMISVHFSQPRQPAARELRLLDLLARQASDYIERKHADAALLRLNETLEQRVVEEIERRSQAEERLRQAQKMEAIGQLTGGVAHDMNNLLLVIQGNLERLTRSGSGDESASRAVEGAMRGVSRAASLTHQLLAFGRRQPLSPAPVAVNRLVANMSNMLSRTLGETIAIETVLGGGVWQTFADTNQLENAILNLAINSRDAMPDGGKLTIETVNAYLDEDYAAAYQEVTPGQYVMVAVSDTGSGMSKEALDKAFEPFYTTKEVGQGTGLGLSQVYGFVKQSGGHVKIYSELGQGTTVRIYLPRYVGETDEAAGTAAPTSIPLGQSGETILVVEDDDDVRTNSADSLRELGYRVLEASDAAEALREIERDPAIRLLFTDVGLPGAQNGRQLADAARRSRPALKVLFTTGYARNAIVHQGRLDPDVEVIIKPYRYAALADKIRVLLDRD